MPSASNVLTDATNLTNSTTGTTAPDQALSGTDAQGLTVALVGIAGALFVFAAINSLSRAATAKVRKQ